MSTNYDAWETSEQSSVARPDKPLWKLIQDKASDDDIHKWLMSEKGWLEQENRERFQVVQRNLARYKGLQYLSQEIRERVRDLGDELGTKKVQKIVANHVYDLVQNHVSRTVKYRPAVAILPTNDEFGDKIGSKLTKALLEHLWYVQQFEGEVQPEFVKLVKTMGECYLGIVFDPDAGDIDPEYKKKYKDKVEAGEKVTLTREDGQPELGEDGKPVVIDRPYMNGDVVYQLWVTLDVLCERMERWKDVRYMFRREVMDLWEARLKYPGKEAFLIEEENALVYDYEKMRMKSEKGKVVVWTLYHKSTLGLNAGAQIVFSSKGILDSKRGPKHGQLPVTRLTDIDCPGELHGHSFIENIAGLVGCYNNLTNSTIENLVMCGRPKWAFPAGSVKKENLGNAITMLEFKGPVAPTLISMNPTPPETYKFRAELKEEFREIAGIFGVSRGEPPPGIKAGVALQFLSEQENERHNETVLKYNEWIRQTAILTLATAGEYYDKDTDRLIRIIGKNNKWMSMFFKVEHLHKDYDIRVQNSSALPQSKAARLQTLLDLNQQFPNQVSPEQVLDMIDLAQDEKFMDITTVSVRAAEAENEQIMEGELDKPINDPAEFEDHVIHWRIHARQLRDWGFKNQTPPEVQGRMKEHLLATELLMVEKAKQNPLYMKQLEVLAGFPLLYKPEISGEAHDGMEEMALNQPPPMEAPTAAPMEGLPTLPGADVVPSDGLPVAEPLPSLDSQALGVAPGAEGTIQPSTAQ